ncbi:MAG: hypothetical protein J6Q58_02815 [Clostridia bacterium]|nr:hypothetical protein [Clostridia bacterium]
MKKFITILTSLILIFTLTGCSGNSDGLDFWQGLLLGGLGLLYGGAYIVGIVGMNELSEGLIALGYIMAILACGVSLVLYGIIYGIWWIIIIAIVLFIAYVIIMKIAENNLY